MGARAKGGAVRRSRWKLAAVVLIWAVFALLVPAFAPLFNAIRLQGFPLGFYLAAQGVLVVFALLGFWAADPGEQQGKPGFSPVLSGMGTAGIWVSGATCVAIAGALFANGYDGLSFIIGFSGGLVIIAWIISPAFAASGSASIEDFLSHRTGSPVAARLTTLILSVCLILLVSAELSLFRDLIAPSNVGISSDALLAAAVIAVIVIAVTQGLWMSRLHAGSYLLVFGIVTLAAGAMSLAAFDVAIPQLSYGLGLQDLATLERKLILDGVSDPAVVRPFVQPNISFSRENFLALTLSLMLGAAAMPQLLGWLPARKPEPGRSHSMRWTLFFVVSLLITLPAVATFAKLDIYRAVARAVTTETAPAWLTREGVTSAPLCGENCAARGGRLHVEDIAVDPEAILPSAAALAGFPDYAGWMLAAALALAAVLAAGYGVAIMTRSIGLAIAPQGPRETASSGGLGRTASLGVTIALVVLAAAAAAGIRAELMTRISWALSLAAAGLFPMLFLAAILRRPTTLSLTAGGLAGFTVALYYIVGTHTFPSQFLMLWHEYSNMPEWRLEAFEELRGNCLDAVAGACAEMEELARDLANWWGIDARAAGIIGAPVGLLVALLLALPGAFRRADA